ncbi:minor histocompatibility antigen H13-like [Artemia franciscana]|uniref:minor histocompatibility antigen H13-like n=1 Tax=Artemia franciscana TaxID=6661 RepID=UPI0032DB2ADE
MDDIEPPQNISFEGMVIAYGNLLVMALLPIFLGAFRSVKHHSLQKKRLEESGEKPDTMSTKDTATFPLIASSALFGIYIFFKIFLKAYINYLLTFLFFIFGVSALTHLLSPALERYFIKVRSYFKYTLGIYIRYGIIPNFLPLRKFDIILTESKHESEGEDKFLKTKSIFALNFLTSDIITAALSSAIGVWYLMKKHWIANDIFAFTFAVNGVELLFLNSVLTGYIFLSCLFIYVSWVFGTNVKVPVTKSFEAQIKLIFPSDLLENGLSASNFAMLGLGDIIIPGIFIALLLRFDHSLNRGRSTYFTATFFAYIAGLFLAIFVPHVFKHDQPALLYLVPACLGTPILIAAIKGDLKALFKYEDHSSEEHIRVFLFFSRVFLFLCTS